MVKTYVMALLMVVASVLGVHAQVTTEPSPLQEDSQDVTIFFHADQGNKGLQGVGPETKVYAHTGVGIHLCFRPYTLQTLVPLVCMKENCNILRILLQRRRLRCDLGMHAQN